jgi:glutamate/tyrosine decarboxylase-like PLP-dependent enzyme
MPVPPDNPTLPAASSLPAGDTLPSLDMRPEEFTAAAGAIATVLAGYLASIGTRPVSSVPDPATLKAAFDEPVPHAGKGFPALLEALATRVLPHTMTIGSPRYFGLFNPSVIPVAALCDLAVSTINQNTGSFQQSSVITAIEDRVIRWLLALLGFPAETATGHFTSGGTAANLTAIKLARDRAAEGVRDRGAAAFAGRARVYASDQSHFSLERAVDVLGLGRSALVRIPSDEQMRLPAAALAARIRADRAGGLVPVAIVATAGTTPSASIDPLAAIADVAAAEQVFLHVDAAYGGAAILSPRLRPRLAGIERADTVTIDPHKWMFLPSELGCVLVRDRRWLRASFGEQPPYLKDSADRADILPDYYREGLQGSRRGKAFTVWGTLFVHGVDALARANERTVELARHLAERVRRLPGFHLCHEPELGLVCCRYAPPGTSPEEQDRLNARIQRRVEAAGEAWFATTTINGRRVLRVNIGSFRTTEEDIERTLRAVVAAAAAAAAELHAEKSP